MLPPEGLLTGDALHKPDDGGRNFRAKFECNRGTGTRQTAWRVTRQYWLHLLLGWRYRVYPRDMKTN
jgi:hypothetical protein